MCARVCARAHALFYHKLNTRLNGRATDGTHMTETSVTINVQDVVDEPPVITVHDNIVMSEELLLGSIVGGLFEVKDADDNDTLTFSIDGNLKCNIINYTRVAFYALYTVQPY